MSGRKASERYFKYGKKEIAHLRSRDKALGALIDACPPIRREVNPDAFAALVESVVGQQISAKAAATVRERLRRLSGMKAEGLSALGEAGIQGCGMSQRKAGYILGIAKAALDGELDFGALARKTDEEVIAALASLNGVGRWTAEMLLIFSLQRPDVVSFGDLAIRRGMERLYGHDRLDKKTFALHAERYSPYGSVASLYLWNLAGQPE